MENTNGDWTLWPNAGDLDLNFCPLFGQQTSERKDAGEIFFFLILCDFILPKDFSTDSLLLLLSDGLESSSRAPLVLVSTNAISKQFVHSNLFARSGRCIGL